MKLKVTKIPKCPKTLTGRHEFYDSRIRKCDNDDCKECFDTVNTDPIKGDIKCVFCGIIDDRKFKQ